MNYFKHPTAIVESDSIGRGVHVHEYYGRRPLGISRRRVEDRQPDRRYLLPGWGRRTLCGDRHHQCWQCSLKLSDQWWQRAPEFAR